MWHNWGIAYQIYQGKWLWVFTCGKLYFLLWIGEFNTLYLLSLNNFSDSWEWIAVLKWCYFTFLLINQHIRIKENSRLLIFQSVAGFIRFISVCFHIFIKFSSFSILTACISFFTSLYQGVLWLRVEHLLTVVFPSFFLNILNAKV